VADNRDADSRAPASPLLKALASPGSWLGLTGTVLVAIAASTAASAGGDTVLPAEYETLRNALPAFAFPLLTLTGVALLVLAWWLMRPRAGHATTDARVVLGLWAIPLALSPLVLSFDAYGYADLGWTLSHGLDPYTTGLRTTGSPYVPGVAWFLQGVRWAYPGPGIAVNGLAASLTGFDPYWGVVAQRLPAWGGVALMAHSLPRIAAATRVSRDTALWFGLLNPVVVLHLLGGAHNDALMTGLGLLAVAVAVAPHGSHSARFVLASAVLGVAVAIKPQVGLLAVAVAGAPIRAQLAQAPFWPRTRLLAARTAVSAGIVVVAVVGISFAFGTGIGWLGQLGHLDLLVTISPTEVVSTIASHVGVDLGAARAAASVVFASAALLGLLALFLLRAADPLAVAAWGSVFVVLGAPALHPWYTVLPLALLALLPLNRRALFYASVVVVAYPVAAYTAALTMKGV
jgi:hypothetical protein